MKMNMNIFIQQFIFISCAVSRDEHRVFLLITMSNATATILELTNGMQYAVETKSLGWIKRSITPSAYLNPVSWQLKNYGLQVSDFAKLAGGISYECRKRERDEEHGNEGGPLLLFSRGCQLF
jgi:hypothetical protein